MLEIATEALHVEGRALVTRMHAAAQAVRLHDPGNEAIGQALMKLQSAADRLLEREGVIDLESAADSLFLNGSRLRTDRRSHAAVTSIVRMLARHGIGSVRVERGVAPSEWLALLRAAIADAHAARRPFAAFEAALADAGASHVEIRPLRSEEDAADEVEDGSADRRREQAKRTYVQSVQVARHLLDDVRLGRAVGVRRVKRAVQDIVDRVLEDATTIIGMASLREFDEYTFTHSVNVCIFSIVLGQKLGLSKLQLYELGLGALFHDIGKVRLDPAAVSKPGELSEAEWREVRRHPLKGLLTLPKLNGFDRIPYRAMLIAYEHHMKLDLSGYPENRRPREPSLFSRIVTVADCFDAMTSRRSYRRLPLPPDRVLEIMRDDPSTGCDPLLVKAFMNVIGVYPIGTLVILDTHELAIVVAPNPDPDRIHQPVVRVIGDEHGQWLDSPFLATLSEAHRWTGRPRRTIIKTTHPSRYGIRIADYFM